MPLKWSFLLILCCKLKANVQYLPKHKSFMAIMSSVRREALVVCLIGLYLKRRWQRQRNRCIWAHLVLRERSAHGAFECSLVPMCCITFLVLF